MQRHDLLLGLDFMLSVRNCDCKNVYFCLVCVCTETKLTTTVNHFPATIELFNPAHDWYCTFMVTSQSQFSYFLAACVQVLPKVVNSHVTRWNIHLKHFSYYWDTRICNIFPTFCQYCPIQSTVLVNLHIEIIASYIPLISKSYHIVFRYKQFFPPFC